MFRVLGDSRLSCRLRIIPTGRQGLPPIKVIAESEDSNETLRGHETEEGHLEFAVCGDRNVIVEYQIKQSKPRSERKGNNSNRRKGRKG